MHDQIDLVHRCRVLSYAVSGRRHDAGTRTSTESRRPRTDSSGMFNLIRGFAEVPPRSPTGERGKESDGEGFESSGGSKLLS